MAWLALHNLYAFQLHALRNRWKGRVLAGGIVIVLDLFLAIRVIYSSGQYVIMCVLLYFYITSLDSVPFAPTAFWTSYSCKLLLLLLLHQALGFPCSSCMWPLFCFCLFFFFPGFRSSVLWWWRCLEGGFERNECRRWLLLSSCSLFILPWP